MILFENFVVHYFWFITWIRSNLHIKPICLVFKQFRTWQYILWHFLLMLKETEYFMVWIPSVSIACILILVFSSDFHHMQINNSEVFMRQYSIEINWNYLSNKHKSTWNRGIARLIYCQSKQSQTLHVQLVRKSIVFNRMLTKENCFENLDAVISINDWIRQMNMNMINYMCACA